jgi:hypothetical protein
MSRIEFEDVGQAAHLVAFRAGTHKIVEEND